MATSQWLHGCSHGKQAAGPLASALGHPATAKPPQCLLYPAHDILHDNLRPAPRHSVTERRCHSSARVGVARELQANTGHVVHNHSSADTAGLNHTGVHGSRQSYRRGHKTLTMRCPVSTGSWLLLVLPAVLPPWSSPAATTVSAVVCTARTTSNSNKSRITYALECRVGPGVGQ